MAATNKATRSDNASRMDKMEEMLTRISSHLFTPTPPATVAEVVAAYVPPHDPNNAVSPGIIVTDDQLDRQAERSQSAVNSEHGGYVTFQHDTGNDVDRPNLRKGKTLKNGSIDWAGSKPLPKGVKPRLCHAPAIDDTKRTVQVKEYSKDGMEKDEVGAFDWADKPCRLSAVTAAAALPALQGLGVLQLAVVDSSGKVVSLAGKLEVTTSAGGSIMLACREANFKVQVQDETGKGTLKFSGAFWPTADTFARNDK